MYLQVVPLIRSIRGKDCFTYQVSDDKSVQIGQIVWVPWRNSVVAGVVWQTNTPSFPRTKTVADITDIILPPAYYNFIEWFADYYVISKTAAIKAILPGLVRNPRQPKPKSLTTTGKPVNLPVRIQTSRLPAVQAVVKALNQNSPLPRTVVYQNTPEIAAIISGLLHKATRSIMIIVPDEMRLAWWMQALVDFFPVAISSQLGQPDLRQVFFEILHEPGKLYIGTKRLCLFPLNTIGTVLAIDLEDSAQKQWDLNPRYHVETILEWWQSHSELQLIAFSQCPRVEQVVRHEIITTLLPPDPPSFRLIDMSGQTRVVSDQVIERCRQPRTTVFWYNSKGRGHFLVCQDCQSLTTDTTQTVCTQCGGLHLVLRGYGTGSVVDQLRAEFPDRLVIEVTADLENHPIPYTLHPLIVGTTALQQRLDWSQVAYTIIISIDQQLAQPDFRSHERSLQQLVWLRNQSRKLDIQTHAPGHSVFSALQHWWPEQWYQTTIQDRQRWSFPPCGTQIQLRHTQLGTERTITNLADIPTDPAWLIDREV